MPDPSAPFDRVPQPLRQALEGRGFTELTPVQHAALAVIDSPRDLRISSQTGSGKTVAFGLAIAPDLLAADAAEPRPGPAVLVIVPTRELAAQVRKELHWLFAAVPDVTIECVTGGTHVGQDRNRLAARPRIVVGTPGRLVDHIGSGALDCNGIRQLVLDEADQMLDLGFRDELDAILAAIPASGRRTHMLSATFPAAVRRLADRFQIDPLHVEGTRLGIANEDIVHVGHLVRAPDRYGAVVNLLLLAAGQRTLIFVATRIAAASLAEKLAGDGFAALALSGELAQAQRTRTLNAFRHGSVNVLVATDVAARGLDVPEVATVIHGDLPMDGEVYTHRSGRTGRAGRKGRSVLLATPQGQGRARRILGDAKVAATWLPVPGAADVDAALTKRARRRVREAIEANAAADTAVAPADLAFAQSLLEGRDPAQVIATLLAGQQAERIRDPFAVDTTVPRAADHGRSARNGPWSEAPPRSPARPRANRGPTRNGPGRDDSFTRFRVNWGFRNGANPGRLLAAICRRGEVSRGVIGAIEIDAYSATFGVAKEAASEFERRARRRDERDPQQRIERVIAGKAS